MNGLVIGNVCHKRYIFPGDQTRRKDNMEQTLYCRDRGLGGQAAQIIFMFSLKYHHGEQIIWSKCCTVTSAQANMTRRTNILYLCEYIQGE